MSYADTPETIPGPGPRCRQCGRPAVRRVTVRSAAGRLLREPALCEDHADREVKVAAFCGISAEDRPIAGAALAAEPLAPVYRWLVDELGFPFDMCTATKPPWLDVTALAAAWAEHDAREHPDRADSAEDCELAIWGETGWPPEGSAPCP